MQTIAWTIVRNQDRYLLVQRAIKDSYGGSWTVPGGSVNDEDISPSGAAIRELNEETGVAANYIRELFNVVLENHKLYVYICDHWDGTPKLCSTEIMGLGWFTIPEIWKLDKSLSPWLLKILPQLTFSVRHDHKYIAT